MIEVSPVTRDAVPAVWLDVSYYVQQAIDRTDGEYELEDVLMLCKEGKMQMLIAHKGWEVYGVIISEVIQYPKKKALNCFALAGKDFPAWIDRAVEVFRQGAAAINADEMKCYTLGAC